MNRAQLSKGVRCANAAYWKRSGTAGGTWLLFLVTCLAAALLAAGVEDLIFNRLSTAEHWQLALSACGIKTVSSTSVCASPIEAKKQLGAIPVGAREYEQSTSLGSAIRQQETQRAADRPKLEYQRYQANMEGTAHDSFTCSTSTESKQIVSFDEGANWWTDDGRCQTRLQKAKDSDAETSSYWFTTLRVDTDMDSFWLPDEERVCQTYPDDKGKVSVVACNQTGNHRDRNIPVRFWGGTERNTISNWKCRREKDLLSDEFVCRAID